MHSKGTRCVGVSEAAEEVNLLEDGLHGGYAALLRAQAHQYYAPPRGHCLQGSLHTPTSHSSCSATRKFCTQQHDMQQLQSAALVSLHLHKLSPRVCTDKASDLHDA